MRVGTTKRLRVKTEMLMVRLSPRTKFALDLIARRRKVTMSQVVAHEIERLIKDPRGDLLVIEKPDENVNLLDVTWHEDALQRFLRLAENFPGLLRPMEEAIWKLINANPKKYFHSSEKETPDGLRTVYMEMNIERIRADWETLSETAATRPQWESDWHSDK